jgi:GMP synthase (glutamine-hydrolysing)
MLAVVQNDPEVPPGLLMHAIREQEIPCRVIRLFSGDLFGRLEGVRGVVVLGGYMSVADTVAFPYLLPLKKRLEELICRGIPILGICLGGQLLAEVLGGTVHLQKRGERGCQQIDLTDAGQCEPLFANLPSRFPSFQWHNDSFDLPPGALHLAGSAACPCQAFRYGRAAYGLQFHPEVTQDIVRQWSAGQSDQRAALLRDFAAAEPAYRAVSLSLLGNFLRMLGPQPPPMLLN